MGRWFNYNENHLFPTQFKIFLQNSNILHLIAKQSIATFRMDLWAWNKAKKYNFLNWSKDIHKYKNIFKRYLIPAVSKSWKTSSLPSMSSSKFSTKMIIRKEIDGSNQWITNSKKSFHTLPLVFFSSTLFLTSSTLKKTGIFDNLASIWPGIYFTIS